MGQDEIGARVATGHLHGRTQVTALSCDTRVVGDGLAAKAEARDAGERLLLDIIQIGQPENRRPLAQRHGVAAFSGEGRGRVGRIGLLVEHLEARHLCQRETRERRLSAASTQPLCSQVMAFATAQSPELQVIDKLKAGPVSPSACCTALDRCPGVVVGEAKGERRFDSLI